MADLSRIYGSQYFEQVITVTNKSEFPSFPRSDILYFIDGKVDLEEKEITVGSSGLFCVGHNLDLSSLFSTADNYIMFSGSEMGNIFFSNMSISVSGAGSSVYAGVAATGNEVLELDHFNYNNCSSLGYLDGFRQGLETVVGRYGGKPELELRGSWSGYKSSVVNTFGLDSDFSGSLFKAGAGLMFNSRFFCDMNLNIPTNASFSDFSISNFASPSLCQIQNAIFARNGVVSTGDNEFFPNLNPEDLVCSWKNNQGLRNTFEGGRLSLSTEIVTPIPSANTFYTILGTWSTDDLQHFSSPSNGQLRNDGTNPISFTLISYLSIVGTANDALDIRVRRWDSENSQLLTAYSQKATVNSLSGPRDVAFVPINYNITMNQNDYIYLEVANLTGANSVTLELDSFIQINTRA